jgi:RNA-binding protein YlmH
MTEEELIKKRLLELAEQSSQRGTYTYTHFLNLQEQSIFKSQKNRLGQVPFAFFGGAQGCERQMLRFGSKETCGYEEPFPITEILIEPVHPKFSEELTHRDFLGALMNLGVDRAVFGDIFTEDKRALIFCETGISTVLLSELTKVRHTDVRCSIPELLPDFLTMEYNRISLNVASERLDAVIAAAYKLSRSKSAELIRDGKVFVNAALTDNTGMVLPQDAIVSVRGSGRFIYRGVEYRTKKDRLRIVIEMP